MKTLSIIHIREVKYRFSTSDLTCYSFSDLRKKVEFSSKSVYSIIVEIQGEMFEVHTITIEVGGSRKSDLDEVRKNNAFDTLKSDIPDLLEGSPELYGDYISNRILCNSIVREKEREIAGYVLTKQYPRRHTTEEHKGGFSDELFSSEYLQTYIKRGVAFGYIGHSCRKAWIDKMLEETCLKVLSKEDFACWLTSTNGRHFGDSLYDFAEENDMESTREEIESNLSRIHDLAIVYNHPEHGGTYGSTLKIFQELKKAGKMMNETL